MVDKVAFLLDTNILSEAVKPQASEWVIDRLKIYGEESAICSIVLHELRFGWLKMPEGKRKQAIGSFVKEVVGSLPCVNYDESAARVHAEIRLQVELQGRKLPFADGQIASIAIANGLTLVTRNIKDFKGIPGIRLANWFDEVG